MSSSPLYKSCQSSLLGQNWPHPVDQYSFMYYRKNLLKPYILSMWQHPVLPHLDQATWVQTGQAPGDQ